MTRLEAQMISSTGVAIAGVTANSREKLFSGGGGTAAFHFTFCLSSWSYRSRGPTAVNVPQFSIPGPFF